MAKFGVNTYEIDNIISSLQLPIEKMANVGISAKGMQNEALYLNDEDIKSNINYLKNEVEYIDQEAQSTVNYLNNVKTKTIECENLLLKKLNGFQLTNPVDDVVGYWDYNGGIKDRKAMTSMTNFMSSKSVNKINAKEQDPIKNNIRNNMLNKYKEFEELDLEIKSYEDLKGDLESVLTNKGIEQLISMATEYGLDSSVEINEARVVNGMIVEHSTIDISKIKITSDGKVTYLDSELSEQDIELIKSELVSRIMKYQKDTINVAIKQLKEIRANIPYENLKDNADYYFYDKEFDANYMDIQMLALAELDANETIDDYGEVSYSEWLEKNGDISPIEFLQAYYMLYDPDLTYKDEKLSEHNYFLAEMGIGNFKDITGEEMYALATELIYIKDINPEYERTYNYLYYTQGIDKANKYLNLKREEIHRIAGEKKASEFLEGLENASDIETYLKSMGKGFEDGLASFSEGIDAWFENSNVKSAAEYEKMYILMALQGKETKIKQGLINSEGLSSSTIIDYTKDYAKGSSYFYKYSQAIGNMAPSMALSMINPTLGSVALGMSAGGQNYHQALIDGYSNTQATIYGLLTGVTSASLEKFLGSIPGLGNNSGGTLLKKMLDEGFEEGLEQLIQSGVWDTMVLGKEVNIDELGSEILQSMIDGAIISGILNAPNSAINVVINGTNYVINLQKAKEIKGLMDSGKASDVAIDAALGVDIRSDIDVNTKVTDIDANTSSDLGDLSYKKSSMLDYFSNYLIANVKKFSYKNTSDFSGLNEQIMQNGLYHFTSEAGASAILKSQKLKASDFIVSYGNKKAFMFNGIPEVGNVATNLDNIPTKISAIKIDPTLEMVSSSKLKVRFSSDQAVTWDGNLDLSNLDVEQVYFCLFVEGDKLVYKPVSKGFYENEYSGTEMAKHLEQFLKNKNNFREISNDFLNTFTHKATNAHVTDSFETNYTTKSKITNVEVKEMVSDIKLLEEHWDLNVINKIIKSENFNATLSKDINKIIIDNQDIISLSQNNFMYNWLIEYTVGQEDIINSLSDINLIRLCLNATDSSKQFFINEIVKRMDEGKILFDINAIYYKNFGIEFDDVMGAIRKLPIDLQNQIAQKLKLYEQQFINNNSKLAELNKQIQFGTIFQRLNFFTVLEKNNYDKKIFDMCEILYDENINNFKTFNFSLFDQTIMEHLDESIILKIGKYPELSNKLISLSQSSPKVFARFCEIINESMIDDSLDTLYKKVKVSLEYMFENQTNLNSIDLDNISNNDLVEYILFVNKQESKYKIDLSEHYFDDINIQCDTEFAEQFKLYLFTQYKIYLQSMKDAYFRKYFSSSYKNITSFLDKYGQHINEISSTFNSTDEQRALTILEFMKYIVETEDVTYLKQIYDKSLFRINGEELLYIDDLFRKKYAETYVDNLSKTSSLINSKLREPHDIINYNGKNIDVLSLDANDDFSFLVHSNDSGFTGNKTLIDDSYISSWYNIDSPIAHLLATSYITSANIGSAPVTGIGVLYGFCNVDASSIHVMAPYDVNSHITGFDFDAGNKQIFISADEMSKNTTRVYNEITIDRFSSTPDYIILYTDSDVSIKENAYKAAAEWHIPIISIDKTSLAMNQLNKINSHIEQFNKSGNLSELESALELYESNISGYRLNADGSEGKFDSIIDNSLVENIFEPDKIEEVIVQYIDSLNNSENSNIKYTELINLLNKIKARYDIANQNGTKLISETHSSIDLEHLIKMAIDARGE